MLLISHSLWVTSLGLVSVKVEKWNRNYILIGVKESEPNRIRSHFI